MGDAGRRSDFDNDVVKIVKVTKFDHSVGFINNEVENMVQALDDFVFFVLDEIPEAARGGDEDVRDFVDNPALLFF